MTTEQIARKILTANETIEARDLYHTMPIREALDFHINIGIIKKIG